MSITISDPEVIARFDEAAASVVIQDVSGRVFGTFAREAYGVPSPEFRSKLTLEQLA